MGEGVGYRSHHVNNCLIELISLLSFLSLQTAMCCTNVYHRKCPDGHAKCHNQCRVVENLDVYRPPMTLQCQSFSLVGKIWKSCQFGSLCDVIILGIPFKKKMEFLF